MLAEECYAHAQDFSLAPAQHKKHRNTAHSLRRRITPSPIAKKAWQNKLQKSIVILRLQNVRILQKENRAFRFQSPVQVDNLCAKNVEMYA